MQMQTTTILQSKDILVYPKFTYKKKKKNNTHINNNNKKETNKHFKTEQNLPTPHVTHKCKPSNIKGRESHVNKT